MKESLLFYGSSGYGNASHCSYSKKCVRRKFLRDAFLLKEVSFVVKPTCVIVVAFD
jgi:hypothetical protein